MITRPIKDFGPSKSTPKFKALRCSLPRPSCTGGGRSLGRGARIGDDTSLRLEGGSKHGLLLFSREAARLQDSRVTRGTRGTVLGLMWVQVIGFSRAQITRLGGVSVKPFNHIAIGQ